MTEGLAESRFYMWRAVFALAHVDGVVTDHELDFLHKSTQDLKLSEQQRTVLAQDLKEPQDPALMLAYVTQGRDREEFFTFARLLFWSDGDFDVQERKMMTLLKDLAAQQDAQALLDHSRAAVQEIKLNKQQWSEDEKDNPIALFFDRLLNKVE